MNMVSRTYAVSFMLVASLLSFGCGGGGNSTASGPVPVATALNVNGAAAANGIFDPSPRHDASGKLWMSYSTVAYSSNAGSLTEVRTRIASSTDGGSTWVDTGVDPNNPPSIDLQVPNPVGSGIVWADWHYEVSSLLYDPFDTDASKRWKMLWHRMLYVNINGASVPSPSNSWIGLSTASAPDAAWSAERKLFAGRAYDAVSANSFIGAPEIHLDTLHAGLNACDAFTESSMLAKADGIYISLQCAGGAGKIIGLKCDRTFTSCSYLGDFLTNNEAAQFSQSGQAINGFAAAEMVTVGSTDYLLVTPYEPPPDTYRGCLAFRISDLATASLARSNGVPALVKRVSGTSGSFNGACGYDSGATGSGIVYSEYNGNSVPNFRMFASHVTLP
jgi:hypothetical protein